MDIELLQEALENDDNLNIINTNIQEIKQKKNEILQDLGLNRDDLKSFHKKLNGYMYIDNIKDLKYGRNIRWVNLNKITNIKITNGAVLCDIKIHDKNNWDKSQTGSDVFYIETDPINPSLDNLIENDMDLEIHGPSNLNLELKIIINKE